MAGERKKREEAMGEGRKRGEGTTEEGEEEGVAAV